MIHFASDTVVDDDLSKPASEHPDRASTWYFSGQLDRPPSIVDDEDATNEIPSSFVSDVINTFSAYQASCLAQLEIFSISFDQDRSTSGGPLGFQWLCHSKKKQPHPLLHSQGLDARPRSEVDGGFRPQGKSIP